MINLDQLDSKFTEIAERLSFRGVKSALLNEIREQFLEKRKQVSLVNQLRSERNALSTGRLEDNQVVIALKVRIKAEETRLKIVTERLQELCLQLPNIPAVDTPSNEDGNLVTDSFASKRQICSELTYEEISKKIEIFSAGKSAKLAGSKFVVYEGFGVKLLHCLINFMLAENQARGYKLISAPYIVNNKNLYNTGQLPKFADDIFKIENYDLSLIPTSEVTLVNLYRDEIISDSILPIKVCSYSPCFRAEVGAAGQENKGLIRLHQFNKVELVNITKPSDSYKDLALLVADALNLLQKLDISYRVIDLCYQELGVSAAKTYDIEIWLPNSRKWLEISSCSNCEDFQANRANIRMKLGNKKVSLHTLNGSALAIDRLILAILEYYYNDQTGQLEVPACLTKYMGTFLI